MIITLKGADFSKFNIGTLSTWRITRSLGSGATYEGVTSVDKGASFSATITIVEGYELGEAGVTVTMGGAVLSNVATVFGNVVTINITEVTGNVVIKVPTVNTSTGGDTPVTGGDGTEANPYMIATASDLVTLGAEVDAGDNKAGKFYALANDIDLTGIEWNPIGADLSNKSGGTVVGFSGTLDGRGHVIRNISINSDTIEYAGLFGGYFDGTLMNLGMEGGSITTTAANSTVGALARKLVSTTNSNASVGKIVNCYSRVPCTAVTRSSGLIDAVEEGGMVVGCYQAATINNGKGYAIKAEPVNSGTIDYCLWNKDLTSKGIASNSVANNVGLTQAEFATAASRLNANMNAVAQLAGVNVGKLVTWTDGTDGYPVLVPGSYGSPGSGDEEPTTPTAYTLTISKGTGVENVTVTKTSGYGTTGALNSGATIYKGDVLTVSATASSGYTLDSYTSSITVNSNVTVNVTATAETPAPDDVTTFAGGAGTETDPYLISNAAEFKLLHDTVDSGIDTSGKHYALTNDIDLSVYSTWDPIGAKDKTSADKDTGFKGTLDGRGHVISGVNVTGVQYAGLFGTNMTGTIMNLGIEDSTFSSLGVSQGTTGSLCRKITAASGKIVNCYSLANVAGNTKAGGLIDDIIGGLVAGCYYAGTATCNTANANFALTSGNYASNGTLAYCLWDSDLPYANGYNTAAKSLTVESCEGKAEITADDMNGNLNAVATLAGIDVAKLCTWEDREGSYPRLVVKSA